MLGNLLPNAYAAVQLADGGLVTSRDRLPSAQIALRWSMRPAGGNALILQAEVTNLGPGPLAIEHLDVLRAPSGLCGAPLQQLKVRQAGWKSNSAATATIPWPDHQPVLPFDGLGPLMRRTPAAELISPVASTLEAAGHQLLAGFVSMTGQTSAILVEPAVDGAHQLTARCYLEGTQLPAGATVRSESLLLVLDECEEAALDRFGRAAACEMHARSARHIPSGWTSWYCWLTEVDEDTIRRMVDRLAQLRHVLELDYVMVDDGYQAAIGDWLTPNDTFPSGMVACASTIRAGGFDPGIWVAPFIMGADSQLYREHPEWVVTDTDGRPIVTMRHWGTDIHALDLTNPGVLAWLADTIRTIVDRWGYRMLKLDFLHHVAIRGQRHDRTKTGMQAYRAGLEVIRRAAGDAFLLGCGAPLLASVGLVDGMRVSPDIAQMFQHPVDPMGTEPSAVNCIRTTMHRWWMREWFVPDPDAVVLAERQPGFDRARLVLWERHLWGLVQGSELTGDEVRSILTAAAMSGGMVVFSEDMARLPFEQLRLAQRLLPSSGRTARPIGPYVQGLSERQLLEIPGRTGAVVCAWYNWHNEPLPRAFSPEAWGLPTDRPYHVYDVWSGAYLGRTSGPLDLGAIPAHGVKLLVLRPIRDRPQLVGSDLHLLGGTVEVRTESWSGDLLTLELACPGQREGTLLIHVPPAFDPTTSRAAVDQATGIMRVLVQFTEHTTVELPFRSTAS